MPKNKISCCTITWTFRPGNPLKPGEGAEPLPVMLRQIKEAGYDGVEGLSFVEDMGGVEGVRRLLGEFGLEPARIGSKAPLREGMAKLRQLGVKVCFADSGPGPWPKRSDFPGDKVPADVLRKYGEAMEESAKITIEEFGIASALHNHLWSLAESREEMDRILEAAPHVYLMLDIAHLKGAGSDPVQAIKDYGKRIAHVHVKDRDERLYIPEPPEPGPWHPGFVPLGKGNVGLDVSACLKALEAVGYDGWISVEQDTSEQPFEDNKANREYLRRLGY